VNPALALLLSPLYDRALAPAHRADLGRSGLTSETIRTHLIRSVPPAMIDQLLGFPTPQVRSAYLLPFPDPRGGWLNHVRLRIVPPYRDRRGNTVKYLQPKRSGVRLFFPLATMASVVTGTTPVYLVEGERKSLAAAQLGLPSVGISGIEGWHAAGSRDLIRDFDVVSLSGRTIEFVPDGDWRTNPQVARGAARCVDALTARGARVRVVVLPAGAEGHVACATRWGWTTSSGTTAPRRPTSRSCRE
jgi:hypothetical protein